MNVAYWLISDLYLEIMYGMMFQYLTDGFSCVPER